MEFEYKVIYVKVSSVTTELNSHGSDGWELVSFDWNQNRGIMKRRIS